jgi:hypothetical protein
MSTADLEYEVISKEDLQNIKPKLNQGPNPLIETLLSGESVFVIAEPKNVAGLYQSAKLRKYKMTLKQGIKNGIEGCLIVWTPLEN